uniref:Delta-like protein n=1 Tax=Rhabditophanes sp. KR3021 TaxID=114890 RepID=A0AC35TQC2_9BILA
MTFEYLGLIDPINLGANFYKKIDYLNKVEVFVKIGCAPNYYGSNCQNTCKQNKFSNKVCDVNGNLVCLEGFEGPTCLQPICKSTCQAKNTRCVRPNECECVKGWSGENCETCIPRPGCVNGYCTKPGECLCKDNFFGPNCTQIHDVCKIQDFCNSHGTCLSKGIPNDFSCLCHKGYEGDRCQKVIGDKRVCSIEKGLKLSGDVWNTDDCRTCSCVEGDVSCSERRCELRDCDVQLSPSKSVVCPFNNVCKVIKHYQDQCLSDYCDAQERGYCYPKNVLPPPYIANGKNKPCQEGSTNCSTIYFEYDHKMLGNSFKLQHFNHLVAALLTLLNRNNVYALASVETNETNKKTRISLNLNAPRKENPKYLKDTVKRIKEIWHTDENPFISLKFFKIHTEESPSSIEYNLIQTRKDLPSQDYANGESSKQAAPLLIILLVVMIGVSLFCGHLYKRKLLSKLNRNTPPPPYSEVCPKDSVHVPLKHQTTIDVGP